MAVPISNVTRRVVFAPSGTGPYAFTFEILAQTDIEVYKGDTLLTLTTDYTVTINPNGTGSVTLVATAGTDNITIIGARAIERSTDFTTGGDFFANTLNTELDSLTIFAQQNSEAVTRALQAPETDPTTIDMTLPRKADRAGKYLAFDADGDPAPGPNSVDIDTVVGIADEIAVVSGISSNVTTVAGISSNVSTVAGIAGNVSTVAGISGNVTTVAGISAAVSTVAADGADIGTVAGLSTEIGALGPIAADITTVAGIDSEVTAVAGDATDIGTVAGSIASVNTVAGIGANVTTVAGISSDVTAVASDATDIGIVAGQISPTNNIAVVAGQATNIAALGPIASDITTVAGDSADIQSLATKTVQIQVIGDDLAGTGFEYDLGSVVDPAVGPGASPDGYLVTVYNNIADVAIVADNVADITNFADVYQGPKASDPATRNDSSALQAGDLYFNTADSLMKVYSGTAWIGAYAGLGDLAYLDTVDTAQIEDGAITSSKLDSTLDLGALA